MATPATLTIGKRLAIGFGLVLLTMVAVTIIGIQKVNVIDATLREITDINAVKQRYAINFRGSVHDRAILLRDVVLLNDAAQQTHALGEMQRLADFYAQSAKPLDDFFATSTTQVTGEERAILTAIKAAEAKTIPLIKEVVALKQAGQHAQAQMVLLQQARPAFTEWLAKINQLIDEEEQKNQKATPNAREIAGSFQQVMILLCVVAIVVGAIVAFFITRHLTRALGGEPQAAADVISQIAKGDLTTTVSATHTGSMLAAVAQMQSKLTHIVSDIMRSSNELTERAEHVAGVSHEAFTAAQRQAQAALTTAASIEEMTNSINEVSQIARQTEANSAKTAELSEKGSQAVKTAAAEIDKIAQTVSASSQQISSLQQRSQEIGGIASVIREIADQTNLLALNAAIEAARAGESGRGFAVVADEVRKLAERTGVATAEIAHMIEQIQQETKVAVEAMTTAVPQVENGLALAREATSVLGEIHHQALDSLAKVRDVAQATAQQVSTVRGIGSNVEQIASMSEATSQSMQNSTQAAIALEKIADMLRQHVSHFQIKVH